MKQPKPPTSGLSIKPSRFSRARQVRPQPEGAFRDHVPFNTLRTQQELGVASQLWEERPDLRKAVLSWMECGLVFDWKCKCEGPTRLPSEVDCRRRLLCSASSKLWWRDQLTKVIVADTGLRVCFGQSGSGVGSSLPEAISSLKPGTSLPERNRVANRVANRTLSPDWQANRELLEPPSVFRLELFRPAGDNFATDLKRLYDALQRLRQQLDYAFKFDGAEWGTVSLVAPVDWLRQGQVHVTLLHAGPTLPVGTWFEKWRNSAGDEAQLEPVGPFPSLESAFVPAHNAWWRAVDQLDLEERARLEAVTYSMDLFRMRGAFQQAVSQAKKRGDWESAGAHGPRVTTNRCPHCHTEYTPATPRRPKPGEPLELRDHGHGFAFED